MSYDMWIILTGALVGAACGIIGTFLVLRKMAMIADAISHTVLLGIVGAFLVSQTLEGPFMLIGAVITGLLTTFFIQVLDSSGVQTDAAIGVVFTALFSVGVILVSLFARNVHLDVDHVLMGDITFIPFHTIEWNGMTLGPKAFWLIAVVLVIDIVFITVMYKELKITSFDPAMAFALGLPVTALHYLFMSMVSITTVASFDSVGAILVVAMLIVPPSTAYLLTDRLLFMILYSAAIGAASAVIGYYIAQWLNVSIAGSMASTTGILFLLAFLFAPQHGIIAKRLARRLSVTES
ncbi:manganese/zinc/iron transport system permease protein [Alteribacillus persepolensis]|uniref:Manganese/zinc/iron transport system permease protein n=1 Tax=Alteribacillus persepolensis TaxID=568899 RepID=A0A1G8FKU1_9BACI|nr:metal ABC transporter permease [Alteribacillus persepolensis]SDH82728.1 manganese/zinc/iron transport system permease protein [Alteribacillus persepolensis]